MFFFFFGIINRHFSRPSTCKQSRTYFKLKDCTIQEAHNQLLQQKHTRTGAYKKQRTYPRNGETTTPEYISVIQALKHQTKKSMAHNQRPYPTHKYFLFLITEICTLFAVMVTILSEAPCRIFQAGIHKFLTRATF